MAKEQRHSAATENPVPDSLVKSKKKKRKRNDDTSTPHEQSPNSRAPPSPEQKLSKKKRKRDAAAVETADDAPSANHVEDVHAESDALQQDTPKKKKDKKKKKKKNSSTGADNDEQQDAKPDSADANAKPDEPNPPKPDDDDSASREHRREERRKKRLGKATENITKSDKFPPLPKRRMHFHGLLKQPLAPAPVVRAMDDTTRHAYLTGVSELCHDVLGQLHTLMTAGRTSSGNTMATLEDQLTTDMVRLRRLPLSRQYVEITLWQRVKDFVRVNLASAEKLAYGAGEGGVEKLVGILRHPPGDVDVHFNSFRDAYLKDVVETYQENLEKIQESEALDKEQVGFLIKSLEAGADLFGNVACWDRRRDNDGDAHGPAATSSGPRAGGG